MEKVARTTAITTGEELQQTETPVPVHELARINQLERLEEDLTRIEKTTAPIPWSP